MSFYSARTKFEEAKNAAPNAATSSIAEGLLDLTRAIEAELRKLDQEIDRVKSRVNSIKTS